MANSYKNAAVVLSSTGSTNLYTCPAATRAIVQSVNVANIDGSDRFVTITWYDASSGSSYTLLNNALIPPGTAMNTIDAAVVLEAGDIIRCQAVTANTLHVTASILEQDPTSAFPEQSVTTTKIANNAVTSAKMATGVSPTIICTSGTRPASPFAGQQIYETDTSKSLVYNGTAWVQTENLGAWTTYTPTLTNIAVGTGGSAKNEGRYIRLGSLVMFEIQITLGTSGGSVPSGVICATLPPITQQAANRCSFSARLRDAGTAIFHTMTDNSTIGRVDVYAVSASGTYASGATPSSTVPFTWAAYDEVIIWGFYEAAA